MTLSLKGHFSYISKYNKLIFVYIEADNDTCQKLERLYKGPDEYATILTHRPFDSAGFTVSLPKTNNTPTDDIRALVGLECLITVKPTHYSFVSQHERNKGERVRGITLILSDIKRGGAYI